MRKIALVVDDDPAIRSFVKTILEREQFETMEADGGHAALEIAKALDGVLGLVITDIQMPNGDGLGFATAVRELMPSVPIIVISGYLQRETRFEFVEKPFTWATLAGVVRRVVACRAA